MKKILFVLLLFLPSVCYSLTVGEPAPAFQTVTVDGKQIDYLKDIKGKKAVYLVFWATW